MVFNIFNRFKKQNNQVYAPITGEIVELSAVPDPVFNQKMMGDGIAILPTKGEVYAPIDCEILHVAQTNHAIGLLTESGSEILIHIGIDTVNLKGEGFTAHVKQGERAVKGDLLIEFDLDFVLKNAPSIVTPIILTNGVETEKTLIKTTNSHVVQGESVILTIE